MKTLKIEVKKRHPYKGQYHEVGEVYEPPEKFARVMIYIGKAVEYVAAPLPEPDPDPESIPDSNPDKGSKPDQVPESATVPEKEAEVEPVSKPVRRQPRRNAGQSKKSGSQNKSLKADDDKKVEEEKKRSASTYKTRDMKAE